MAKVKITEFRMGRNFVRVGDTVKVVRHHGVRTSFKGKVVAIKAKADGGEVVEIDVYGGPGGRAMMRTFSPAHLARVAQSRVEARKP